MIENVIVGLVKVIVVPVVIIVVVYLAVDIRAV